MLKRFLPTLHRGYVLLNERRAVADWNRRGRTPPTPHLIKQELLSQLQEQHRFVYFIETGTFKGDMVAAMQPLFERLVSIELSNELFARARERFASLDKIDLVCGDSGKMLPSVLEKVCEPALFWLDGHYSGGQTARGDVDSPIVVELNTISNHKVKNHGICIDDARLFVGADGYPKMLELKEYLINKFPEHEISEDNDIVTVMPKLLDE